ncbi:hypothetical protein MNBD_PLANCTO03-1330 [hydrothermal vent metagenome]|uniref:Uncharacterized protein n=1 Tax=hydrothermal vent metagenome TaxID=652676 RepID=A0A3B1DM57_9ZZZZ
MLTMILTAAKLLTLMLGLLGIFNGATIHPQSPTPDTHDQPATTAQPTTTDSKTPTEIATADDLLRALETAGQDTRLLSATIRYVKEFAIQGDTQRRDGRLVFASDPGLDGQPPTRRFGITFDRYEVGGRVEDRDLDYLEQYIFDGEWLAEIRPLEKQFVRRQVVPPGQKWDPLRLGEGPFPIPIQQKREEILSRFEAELLDGQEGVVERRLMGVTGKCYQLKLTPRPDAGESDLREIRVWYQKDTLLPRMAKTTTKADDTSLVLLKDLKLNAEAKVSKTALSTDLPADRTGWDITNIPYRE